MKVGVISTATNQNHPGFEKFRHSLEHNGWPYNIIGNNYMAYGSKMVNAYEFAKQNDYTHLFILDAYDVVVTAPMKEVLDKIGDLETVMFNAEKACWPYPKWKERYPEVESEWKYLNGGAAFVSVPIFIKMFEDNPIKHSDNDQVNLAEIYLTKRDKYNMKLDNNCEIFQSIAFANSDEFLLDGEGLYNPKTGTHPKVFHGNGGTDMEGIYKALRLYI